MTLLEEGRDPRRVGRAGPRPRSHPSTRRGAMVLDLLAAVGGVGRYPVRRGSGLSSGWVVWVLDLARTHRHGGARRSSTCSRPSSEWVVTLLEEGRDDPPGESRRSSDVLEVVGGWVATVVDLLEPVAAVGRYPLRRGSQRSLRWVVTVPDVLRTPSRPWCEQGSTTNVCRRTPRRRPSSRATIYASRCVMPSCGSPNPRLPRICAGRSPGRISSPSPRSRAGYLGDGGGLPIPVNDGSGAMDVKLVHEPRYVLGPHAE